MAIGESSNVDAVFDDVERFVERTTLGVVGTLHEALTELNPVDTGWSRSNWLVSIGAPRLDTIGSKADVDDGAGEATLREVRDTWKLFRGDIFVVNNVDYVVTINRRHSRASGYVEVAVERAVIIGPGSAIAGSP